MNAKQWYQRSTWGKPQTKPPNFHPLPTMAIFLHFPALSLRFLALFLLLLPSSFSSPSSSIYDQLSHYGLPIGLLPKGITDFSVDPTTGRFRFNLTQPCNAKFETQVRYDFNVTGLLSFGRIGELSGISAQELFLWFPVKGIRVDVPSSGLIYFDVVVVDKQFSLSLFESPPDCTADDPSTDRIPEVYIEKFGYQLGQREMQKAGS